MKPTQRIRLVDGSRWLCHYLPFAFLCLAWLHACPDKARADFYVHTFENSKLYSTNPDTGSATLIGTMTVNQVTDLAMAASGQLYAATQSNLYSVNPSTAATTLIGPFTTTTSMVGLDMGPAGVLYGLEQFGARIFTINTSTGAATPLFSTPFTYTGDIAHYSGNVFYATGFFGGGSRLIEINIGTASAVDRGLIAANQNVPALDFDASGRLIAFSDSGFVYHIPNFASSGAGVLLSNNGVGNGGAALIVPEPSSIALLGLGLLSLLGYRQLRRKGRASGIA
jgi:hypothetical protein